jgi:hypothetical protein
LSDYDEWGMQQASYRISVSMPKLRGDTPDAAADSRAIYSEALVFNLGYAEVRVS